MTQRRLHSLGEQVLQASLKFITAMACWQWIVAPLFGYRVTLETNFYITFIFMINSLFFGYWIRRLCNWLQHRGAQA